MPNGHAQQQRDVVKRIQVGVEVCNVVGDVGHVGIERLELLFVQRANVIQRGWQRLVVEKGATGERRVELQQYERA